MVYPKEHEEKVKSKYGLTLKGKLSQLEALKTAFVTGVMEKCELEHKSLVTKAILNASNCISLSFPIQTFSMIFCITDSSLNFLIDYTTPCTRDFRGTSCDLYFLNSAILLQLLHRLSNNYC